VKRSIYAAFNSNPPTLLETPPTTRFCNHHVSMATDRVETRAHARAALAAAAAFCTGPDAVNGAHRFDEWSPWEGDDRPFCVLGCGYIASFGEAAAPGAVKRVHLPVSDWLAAKFKAHHAAKPKTDPYWAEARLKKKLKWTANV